jgi:hypothetical protein
MTRSNVRHHSLNVPYHSSNKTAKIIDPDALQPKNRSSG